jgi:hypothetical protein
MYESFLQTKAAELAARAAALQKAAAAAEL